MFGEPRVRAYHIRFLFAMMRRLESGGSNGSLWARHTIPQVRLDHCFRSYSSRRGCPSLYLGTTTRHFGYQQENGTLSLGRQQVHFVQEESTMEKTCDLITARIGIVLRTIMRFYPVSARVN